ncbi:MAG: hypothetical protein GTO18_02380 [Anaerolineales bacterium]|nr:hypothetical protein [Anaerolineales bacterium]
MTAPKCPSCGAPGLIQTQSGGLHCHYCHSSFKGKPYLCPSCGWINFKNEESCPKCGEPLTVVSQVMRRQDVSGTPSWLERSQSQASDLKDHEEKASQRRLSKLIEIDRRREDALAEEAARRAQRDRKLFTYVFLFGIIFITIIIFLAVFLG